MCFTILFFHEKGDTIILPCHLDNDDQNPGDLYWIKSETGSPNGRILTQGNIIVDYDLQDRIDEDELELNSEINGKAFKMITEGSRLMRISLLRFFKKIHKFALCEFMPYALSYFISLVQFFWLYLANANFGYFFPEPKVALSKDPL